MAATTIIAEMTKEIKYDRATGDYACYLNGELIGYESTYSQAETFISNTYYEMLTHASAPAAEPLPAVDVETWQDETGAYTDFGAGDELTRAVIGSYNGDKPGVELIIGGTCINQYLEQVLTLADIRQLCDNLTALLQDTRLQAIVQGGAPCRRQLAA